MTIKVHGLSPAVKKARRLLKEKGWSYRSAARPLNVSWQHIAHVLTGRRESRRLLTRIEELPPRKAA